ncbi:LysM peptidoglycan-binding domain-containing protein [Halosquirtibacter laminarini]|uniref:LysM peptidoglycan-binding domain-containing protein n=1 Tax=Halosquirtibacter laminarini TaxID=3374600 RepID=A0AC61NB83_9BACT|nr:LysM peptidoglycan-binding domain-containing protein [Prolixibacteraceae bacterium]
MKLRRFLFIIILIQTTFFTGVVYAQSQNDTKVVIGKKVYILHRVEKKETVYSIQKKYNIEASKLYGANPNLSSQGLKAESYIKIPISRREQKKQRSVLDKLSQDNDSIRFHKVHKKETLFSIARSYGVTVEEIERANGINQDAVIKKGDLLRIPIKEDTKENPINPQAKISTVNPNFKQHIVTDGETLFSISREHNIPFSELKKSNPSLGTSISVNDTILIPLVIGKRIDQATQKVIENKYFYYRISTKDTYWKLDQKYGVTKSEILQYNPILNDALIPGIVIRLPYRRTTNEVVRILDNDNFYQYHVEAQETLYTIAKKHGVTVRMLKEINPKLKVQGLMKGDVIIIPKPQIASSFEAGINDSILQSSYLIDKISFLSTKEFIINPNSETFNIGVMVPIYSEVNKQLNNRIFEPNSPESLKDTTKVTPHLYSRSKNFLSFYEGMMMGIDSLNRKGLNVKVYLFDTEKKTQSIDSLYATGIFSNLDLIVGPIFPNTQQAVMKYIKDKNVPVISPLSSNDKNTKKYENLYQVNPSSAYKAKMTSEYVIDTYLDQNIIAFKTNDEVLTKELVTPVKDAMFKEHVNRENDVNFTEFKLDLYGIEGLRFILKRERPNVILLPSKNEAVVSQTLGQLNALALDFNITVIGFNEWTKYRSVKEEVFHNLNLKYLTPYHINYQATQTISFIKNYKKYYYAEPNNFAFQGFDISIYFGEAMLKYGNNFPQMMIDNNVTLNQMNPNFVKISKFGGFMNHTLFIMNYNKEFEVKCLGTTNLYRSIPIRKKQNL